MAEDSLLQRAEALSDRLVEWRRDLHRHPELGFEEHRTGAFVASRLGELGLEVKTGLAGTGVVGILRASPVGDKGNKESKKGKAILLRADMDALPIQEVSGREYGSTVDGRMHACGHDGHTSMLIGAATLLVEQRQQLQRDVVFCFQPAEEGGGGAERMIAEGVLDLADVGSAYALHLWSPLAAGSVAVRSGPAMAAQDEFRARVVGRGGHGALPHTALDPIIAAAQAIVALQAIVSRSIDPVEAAVVTVGSLHAGDAPNVIPHDALLAGTLRAFDAGVRQRLRDRVTEVLEGSVRAAGCSVELELIEGYPAVINAPEAVERVRRAAPALFGSANVFEPAPMAAAEDFSYFLERRPGAFILLGAGNEGRGITAPHHSPEFDIDESALPLGTALLARLALQD